jgi:asparagine N-glycosylation enzyme membrane subunit Stt3
MSESKGQNPHRWLSGGLGAASFAAVLALVGVEHRDKSLHIALLLFSVALPLDILIFVGPIPKGKLVWPIPWHIWFLSIALVFYIPTSLGGIAAIFWHFGCIYGLIFSITSLFGCVTFPFLFRHWLKNYDFTQPPDN